MNRHALAVCAFLTVLVAGSGTAAAAPGDLLGTFASGGVHEAPWMTTFPGYEDSHKVALDASGRTYVAATVEPQLNGGGGNRLVRLQRLTAGGLLDPAFGPGGTVTLPVAGDTRLAGLAVDALDRPVIAGANGSTNVDQQIVLVRLSTGGAPDTTFSADGQLVTKLPGDGSGAEPVGMAIDAGGGVLVAGNRNSANVNNTTSGFVARFDAGGTIDGTYGAAGWRAVGPGGPRLEAIHALPGGGAVVAGFDYLVWEVARLTAGGALDPAFDTDGIATSDLGRGALDLVTSYALTVDTMGRPIVVGQLTAGGSARLAVARFTAGGSLDGSFGTGSPVPGVALLAAAVGSRATGAAMQCDGRILVVGMGPRAAGSGNGLMLARFTSAGTLDPLFAAASGVPGVARLALGQHNIGSDLAVGGTGATVAGFRRSATGVIPINDAPAVARFEAGETCADPPPAPGPDPTPQPEPGVTSPPVPVQVAASPVTVSPVARPTVLPALTSVVSLPSTRRCVSRRRFSIRLRVPRGSAVVSVTVRVNGRSVAVRRGARLRSTVNLRSLPKGRFRVEIRLTLADGRIVSGTRRYRTCTPKRPGTTKPKV